MTAWKLVDNYSDHWTDLLHAKVECRQRGEHPRHTLLYHSPIRKKVKHATKTRAANNNSLDSEWSAPVHFLAQRHRDHYSYKMWLPGGGQYLTIWGLDSPINCLSPGSCFVASNMSRFVVLYWKETSAKSVCPARHIMIRARGRRWGIFKYITWRNEMRTHEWKCPYSSKEMCIMREISEGGHIPLYLYLVGNSILM